MATKATHKGHCQMCNRLQKLPKGKLAKHGYTIEWSTFQGTCPGSGELPYQQSCDLIKLVLPNLEIRLRELREKQKQLLEPATEPKAYVRVYLSSLRIYVRRECELIEQWKKNGNYEWQSILANYEDRNEERITSVGMLDNVETLLKCATRLNHIYAKSELERVIKDHSKYLEWCQQRVNEWAEEKLEAIE